MRRNRAQREQYKAAKDLAYKRFKAAVSSGKLAKQPCEICGGTYRVHGHHEDYSKPLDVRWLCSLHHGNEHRATKQAAPILHVVSKEKYTVPLPPGVTGPRWRRYIATGQNGKHLGMFATIAEAVEALKASGNFTL